MFRERLVELDCLREEERASACLLGLEQCALTLARLSGDIEAARQWFMMVLNSDFEGQPRAHTDGTNAMRRMANAVECAQDVDDLLDELRRFAPTSGLAVAESEIVARSLEYLNKVRPLVRKRKEVVDLANALSFRLFGISPVEAQCIRDDLRARGS